MATEPRKPKTAEELKKEREEAQQQLDALLSANRPRNLGEGLTTGVSTIVAGAVGAAGVAVLLPTLGLVAGASSGGIIGGALGIAVGVVAGAVGGAALAVGGLVSGVVQIGRGVAAVPESILAPRSGKWWNENLGKWIYTDLKEDSKKLDGVPEDDSDILKQFQDEVDASAELGTGGSTNVVDPYYYDVLEVPPNADPSLIKRRYYLLARQYHPDKVGTEDKAAAEKFKEVAEAYQVLSDPELRKKYDTDGRAGLSPDKTSVAGDNQFKGIDPALLFAFLFGSDKFHNYVGRLSTATASSVGDTPKVTLQQARKLQERRVTRLALFLVDKVTPWVEVSKETPKDESSPVRDDIEAAWLNEGIELSHASFGYQLVTTIGKIYNLLAIVYEGSLDSGQGLPGLSKWAKKNRATIDSKHSKTKVKIDAMRAGLDMMKLKAEAQIKLQEATSDEEKQKIIQETNDATIAIMVRILWTTAVVDITAALHEATQMLFFDHAVDAGTRKYRAKAIKKLGEIWANIPEPADTVTATHQGKKDEKQLYEEAAFAAMVETVKRKDEAAYHANHSSE